MLLTVVMQSSLNTLISGSNPLRLPFQLADDRERKNNNKQHPMNPVIRCSVLFFSARTR
jgi:hypothetical protein